MESQLIKKTNKYFLHVYKRRNFVLEYILGFFFGLSSWPRLVLEVFIRRNMGERYFSLASAFGVAVVLAAIPFYVNRYDFNNEDQNVVLENSTWYLFIVAFAVFSVKRWREVLTLPSVYELKRFSLSSGLSFSFFYEAGFNGPLIPILLEPVPVIFIGLLLYWMGQMVGLLLMACAVIYSLSYMAAVYQANNFIMDKIDEMICNEELHGAFVDKKDPRDTRGFEFVGNRPKDHATRERVSETFWEEDAAPEVK